MNIRKFKKIYLAILIPLTVIICIVSVCYRTVVIARDFTKAIVDNNWGEAITTVTGEIKEAFKVGTVSIDGIDSGNMVENVYTDIVITDIDIDLAFANVEIREGDSYRVEVNYPEMYLPEVEIEKNVLKIYHSGSFNKISFGGMNKISCDVTIYLPEGAELNNVELTTDLGNVEINDSFDCKKLEIVASLGNVEIGQAKAGSLTIQADLGNVEIKNSSFGDVDIHADLGDISVKRSEFEVGEIKNDLGAIEVSGTFKNLEAECSLGELTVDCDNISDAKMDLKTDLGGVSVNGKSKGGSYKQ